MCAHDGCCFSARYTVHFDARDLTGSTRGLCPLHTRRVSLYLVERFGKVNVHTERIAA